MTSTRLHDETTRTAGGLLEGASVVVSAPVELAAKLETGLRELGAAVAVLDRAASSRAEATALVSGASERLGGVDALIHVPAIRTPPDTPFAATDEQAWIEDGEAPIWRALVLFQAAYEAFPERGGSITALVPSIALTGAAGLVAFAAASEGIRQLVKSAARAWGAQGTRANCLTLPIAEWGVEPRSPVPNRYGSALAGHNTAGDMAGAAALLISPLAGALTGATLGLDRGTVLAP